LLTPVESRRGGGGASIGSILGMFRAREEHYRDSMVRAVTHGLTFKKLFRVLEVQSRFGVPGPLRLYLRSALSRFFVAPGGEAVRIGELTIPFICVVTGIRREAIRRELYDYEKAFARELSRGAFSALLHVKDLISSWASLIGDLVATQGAMKPVAIGADADITIFDPAKVIDRATFEAPTTPSAGIPHVLVNGTFVVRDGELVKDARPGRAVRVTP
jgi:hypothetical protein